MSTFGRAAQLLLDRLNAGDEPGISDILKLVPGRTERQARRWIGQLRAAGVPVRERRVGRKKRFFLQEPHRTHELRPVALAEEEILAVTVAAQAARSVLRPTPLREALECGFRKLLAQLATTAIAFDVDEEERQWHFAEAPSVPIDRATWMALREAIESRRSVRIDYYSASTERPSRGRCVDPYCLAVRNGSWLLVAWCHRRRAVREFSLPDVSRVVPLDPERDARAYFDLPDDFDASEHFSGRFHALAGGAVRPVRLLVEPHQARWFARKTYHPSQAVEERRDDGRIVVRFEVSGLDEIRSFAQSWGGGVTVLEPRELVEMMREDLETLATRYRDGASRTRSKAVHVR